MADKAVERVEPPFRDNWVLPPVTEGEQIAYVMVYTHVDDTVESIAFNKLGQHVGQVDGDFRRTAAPAKPAVKASAPAKPGDTEGPFISAEPLPAATKPPLKGKAPTEGEFKV